jgi:hypothetical protein
MDDVTVFEAARSAIGLLKKTFETWVTIGRAVVRAREIADRRGGGKTFMRLIEQQSLAPLVDKATASRLERIMKQLPAVIAWHETLTTKQKIEWAAPTTIMKRCPVFNKPKPALDEPKPPTKGEQDRMALAAALEEIEQLKKRADGDTFKPSEPINDIARALYGTFEGFPHEKGEKVAKMWLKLINDAKAAKRAKAKAA